MTDDEGDDDDNDDRISAFSIPSDAYSIRTTDTMPFTSSSTNDASDITISAHHATHAMVDPTEPVTNEANPCLDSATLSTPAPLPCPTCQDLVDEHSMDRLISDKSDTIVALAETANAVHDNQDDNDRNDQE
jgi:hypothetical protein